VVGDGGLSPDTVTARREVLSVAGFQTGEGARQNRYLNLLRHPSKELS